MAVVFGVSGGPEVGYRRVDTLLIGCGHNLENMFDIVGGRGVINGAKLL